MWITPDRRFIELDRFPQIRGGIELLVEAALQIGRVGIDVLVRRRVRVFPGCAEERDLERARDGLCDLRLHREDVGQRAIIVCDQCSLRRRRAPD